MPIFACVNAHKHTCVRTKQHAKNDDLTPI